MDRPDNTPERLRLLECWLPLAHTLNAEFGWGLDAQSSERLVLLAAASLANVGTLADARAVLYYHHARLRGGAR